MAYPAEHRLEEGFKEEVTLACKGWEEDWLAEEGEKVACAKVEGEKRPGVNRQHSLSFQVQGCKRRADGLSPHMHLVLFVCFFRLKKYSFRANIYKSDFT